MSKLDTGKTIIYERNNNTVYGRYHGETERWIVGSTVDPESVLDYTEWQEMTAAAHSNPVLKSLIDKCINTYRLMKS